MFDGATKIGSADVVSAQAKISTSVLAEGPHTISAKFVPYTLNAPFASSTSLSLQQSVLKMAASTTLTATPNPSALGKPVTLNAAVSPTAATGTITFYDGTTLLGTSTLVAGAASFTAPSLAIGPHSLTAYNSGDSTYLTSRSVAVSQTVTSIAGAGFAPAVNYSVGTAPTALVSADLNHDGKLDLVAVNLSSSSISVLIGNGDGTFKIAQSTAVGIKPDGVAVADFNADGVPDLAVSNYGDETLSILIGNGDGTFKKAIPYALPAAPGGLTVADFNGDGKPDVAVLYFNGSIAILVGKGDGTLATSVNVGTAGHPSSGGIASGDFNKDGTPDLVIVSNSGIQILLGVGDGTFQQTPFLITQSQHVSSFVVADLDPDGNLDLCFPAGLLQVLLGNGDGTFKPATSFPAPLNASPSAVADFNSDGKPDVVVTGFDSNTLAGVVAVNFGLGSGNFQNPVGYAVGQSPVFVAVGDFNGVGRADLVVVNIGGNNVSVLLALAPQQSILFPQPPGLLLSAGTVTLTATATSGLPVTFTSNNSFICFVSGATAVTLLNVGTCSITASQPGNSIYAAASPVSQSFSVTATPVPSLRIFLSHVGSFAQSQVGATYTVTVANLGTAPTSGQINASLFLPTGLTPTSIAGNGWNCTSTTCTRSDALAPGSNYPQITATVTVADNASTGVTQARLTGRATANDATSVIPALTDTTPTDYFFPAVNLLREYGITGGCGTNIYCPNDNVTRAQMAIFIVRTALGGDNFTYSASPYFVDVNSTTFGFKWIHEDVRTRHYRRLRRRELLSQRQRHPRANGHLRYPSPLRRCRRLHLYVPRDRNIRRRPRDFPLLQVDPAHGRRPDHRGLRRRQLLPERPRYARPNGDFPDASRLQPTAPHRHPRHLLRHPLDRLTQPNRYDPTHRNQHQL